MNIAAAAAVMLGLAASGPVLAQEKEQVSNADYLAAARCQGLAVGAGVKDGTLDAFVKRADRRRMPAIAERAGRAFDEARKAGRRNPANAQAELSGACMAYRAPATAADQPAAN